MGKGERGLGVKGYLAGAGGQGCSVLGAYFQRPFLLFIAPGCDASCPRSAWVYKRPLICRARLSSLV
jgi:hypothetical protein